MAPATDSVEDAAAEEGRDDDEAAEGGGAAESSAASGAAGGKATGVDTVSIGNSVVKTGGAYSAGDTAPHELRATRTYVSVFTATELPLDRPWDGPTASGLTAFRVGAAGDLRALWRQSVTLAPAARASASERGSELAPALDALSTAARWKEAPPFPATHKALRDAMATAAAAERARGGRVEGLDTVCTPGALDSLLYVPRPARAADDGVVQQGPRVSVRSLVLTKAGHLSGAVKDAVRRAQLDAVKKQIEAAKPRR